MEHAHWTSNIPRRHLTIASQQSNCTRHSGTAASACCSPTHVVPAEANSATSPSTETASAVLWKTLHTRKVKVETSQKGVKHPASCNPTAHAMATPPRRRMWSRVLALFVVFATVTSSKGTDEPLQIPRRSASTGIRAPLVSIEPARCAIRTHGTTRDQPARKASKQRAMPVGTSGTLEAGDDEDDQQCRGASATEEEQRTESEEDDHSELPSLRETGDAKPCGTAFGRKRVDQPLSSTTLPSRPRHKNRTRPAHTTYKIGVEVHAAFQDAPSNAPLTNRREDSAVSARAVPSAVSQLISRHIHLASDGTVLPRTGPAFLGKREGGRKREGRVHTKGQWTSRNTSRHSADPPEPANKNNPTRVLSIAARKNPSGVHGILETAIASR